jgi:hypothetical protein
MQRKSTDLSMPRQCNDKVHHISVPKQCNERSTEDLSVPRQGNEKSTEDLSVPRQGNEKVHNIGQCRNNVTEKYRRFVSGETR